MKWQKIDTAPKIHEEEILLVVNEDGYQIEVVIGVWNEYVNSFAYVDGCNCYEPTKISDPITHWMPLPQPPQD